MHACMHACKAHTRPPAGKRTNRQQKVHPWRGSNAQQAAGTARTSAATRGVHARSRGRENGNGHCVTPHAPLQRADSSERLRAHLAHGPAAPRAHVQPHVVLAGAHDVRPELDPLILEIGIKSKKSNLINAKSHQINSHQVKSNQCKSQQINIYRITANARVGTWSQSTAEPVRKSDFARHA